MKILLRKKIESIKVGELFTRLGIEDNENEQLELKWSLKVKTPYGFKNIRTAFRTENQPTVTTYFGNNKTLKTSGQHRLKSNGEWKHIDDLNVGDVVETENDVTKIIKKSSGKNEVLYDISVEEVHCYYSNGILSHNSWALARLGAEAMKQGKTVLHFTMELNENYVGLRYDSCFTGIDFQNIRSNVEIVKTKIKDVPGKLFIKYFPIKSVSSQGLQAHAERLAVLGFPVDIMIVDYADILRPIHCEKNSNSYSESGGIYEELRGTAGALQIPIWSASQSNRDGIEEDIIGAKQVADSYRKIMTADVALGLSRKTSDKVNDTARFHVIKNRFGPDGMTFPARMNAGCGDIQLFEAGSTTGIALQSLMDKSTGDTDNDLKNTMRKRLAELNK
jgi:hypothetical protein